MDDTTILNLTHDAGLMLIQRGSEADVGNVCWFRHNEDLVNGIYPYYCEQCIKIVDPDALYPEDYVTVAYELSSKQPILCTHCSRLLQYNLTYKGFFSKMHEYEKDPELVWDWENATDCYHLSRLTEKAYLQEHRVRLIEILKRGQNCPTGIKF